MSLLTNVEDRRHFPVPKGKEFILSNENLPVEERTLRTLDDLSEAINLIDPETFHVHVNESKNDFANWVEYVFGEVDLAAQLRKFPTPLRMMVSIEKFLR
ncbi:MAG: hypothetical protein K0S20_537 [Patescibacteria group bacterium]|jgi:hypothetical protein|nr:hypothetical protein [Patescibacteria group bacterium]